MIDSEENFLKNYNRRDYLAPLVTVDSVIFTYHNNALHILLTERGEHPEKNKWALPGGFIDEATDISLEEAAQRKLQEKTGVKAPYIEQLTSIGNHNRDPRGWSVTVVYTALIAFQECETYVDSVSDVRWLEYEKALTLNLAFDHMEIIKSARERIKQKALYSMVPAYALPEAFTLPELQHFLEVLIDKTIQKKSFRRRIEQADLVEEIGLRAATGKGRPSILYRLKETARDFTFIRNLEA